MLKLAWLAPPDECLMLGVRSQEPLNNTTGGTGGRSTSRGRLLLQVAIDFPMLHPTNVGYSVV